MTNEDVICWALKLRDDRVSAIDKYFLIAVWRRYGTNTVTDKVKDLAQKIQLNDRYVSSSRNAWVEVGVVELCPMPGAESKRGRRQKSFRINIERLAALVEGDKAFSLNQNLIRGLFCQNERLGRIRVKREEGSDALTVNSLVLLGVLVMSADKTGYVSGYGEKALREMAGLEKSQFRYALNQLAEVGVLGNWLPGISSKHLFGRRPGVYWLNLGHSFFGEDRVHCIYVFDRLAWRPLDRICDFYGLFGARTFRRLDKEELAKIEQREGLPAGWSEYFRDRPWFKTAGHLACLLAQHACLVLERRVVDEDGLGDGEGESLSEDLGRELGTEHWFEHMAEDKRALLPTVLEYLVDHGVKKWADAAMSLYKEALKGADLECFLCESTKFRIYSSYQLINAETERLWTLAIFPGSEKQLEESIFLFRDFQGGKKRWERLNKETEIKDASLVHMGLRKGFGGGLSD